MEWYFLGGIITACCVLFMEKPFHILAIRSVGLLDALLDPNEGEVKLQQLSIRIKHLVYYFFVFIGLSILTILPTLALTFIRIENINSSSNIHWGLYLLGSILPFVILQYYPKKSNYSSLSQLLHRLILNHYHLGTFLLNKQIKTSPKVVQPKAILITGLARSGTTAIAKLVGLSPDIKSLNYSNMPFVLYPRFWNRIYRPPNIENNERVHGDGVKIGLSSIEALEEYCFKVITNDNFIDVKFLNKHDLSDEQLTIYQRYQFSISGEKTYLAKNNNALLRLTSILKNPNQHVFIMYRSPLDHAFSLLKQHQLFLKKQLEDPFVLEYMNWLGHHEFGKNQKTFHWGEDYKYSDANDINFWLESWIKYYKEALKFKKQIQINFMCYESFLNNPKNALENMANKCNISLSGVEIYPFDKKYESLPKCDNTLLEEAEKIYNSLMNA